VNKMFSLYCQRCRKGTIHNLYISSANYIHADCSVCGWEKSSSDWVPYGNIDWEGQNHCNSCGTETRQFKYTGPGRYLHWFCCGCGTDKCSRNPV